MTTATSLPPLVQNETGLTARELLIGCVAENDPKSLGQAIRLIQSIRWFGGGMADATVMVCVVGGIGAELRRILESYGAEIRIVAPLDARDPTANRLRFFEQAAGSEPAMLLLLDCDTLVVRDPLPLMRRGSLQAQIAPVPTVTHGAFERVFRHFGLDLPPREHVNEFTGTPTIRYCSSGMVLIPAGLAKVFIPVWRDYNLRMLDHLDLLQTSERHSHQASLTLAFAACPIPFTEAPVELDYPLNLTHFDPPPELYTVDPAILHYDDRVDAEGYLLASPYPLAQVRIEAFNRRLRQERGPASLPIVSQTPERSTEPQPAGPRIFVLGMHRSGTSVLVSLLRLMGCFAGSEEDLSPAGEDESMGYGEHRGVWSLDEAILRSLGASWCETAGLELSTLRGPLLAWFEDRARTIARDLDRFGPWAVKDPRLCLLFPLWRRVLERTAAILIYRDPLPVARSLQARDGLPLAVGIALWEHYNRAALASTQGTPRILLSYRDLLGDPVATVTRPHRELLRLGIPGIQRLRVPSVEEIRTLVKPSLEHQASDPELERGYLNLPQSELLQALASGAALDLDPVPPLSAGARDVLLAHSQRIADERSLRRRIAEDAELSAALHTRAARNGETIDSLHARVARNAETIDSLHARVAEEAALRSQASADVHRTTIWIEALDSFVSALLTSRSWKIGSAMSALLRPLRFRKTGTTAAERRDRVMDEYRRWRSHRK
jgi:hypothetical protein